MANKRLRGEQVTIKLIQNGAPTDTWRAVASGSLTCKNDILEEEFLGETAPRFDAIFKGWSLDLDAQPRPLRHQAAAGGAHLHRPPGGGRALAGVGPARQPLVAAWDDPAGRALLQCFRLPGCEPRAPHPDQRALPRRGEDHRHDVAQPVLGEAIQHRGSSISDYRDADGQPRTARGRACFSRGGRRG